MVLNKTQRADTIRLVQVERAILKREAPHNLKSFTQLMWPIIEPATPYIDGWHITAVCRHLEACSRFDIRRLLINMPPRHMKSILVSVMFPAWIWLLNPERRFICASYARALAVRDGIKMRTLIDSALYQDSFKPKWTLRDDKNEKLNFENTATGFRLSTSVEGQATGEGGDFLIVDDPLSAQDAVSVAAREGAARWLKTVMSSRANNAKRHCRIMVMQRLHDEDPSGVVLKDSEKENAYEPLILQARYESKPAVKSKTSLGFVDPRRVDGELLWPERFDEKAIKELELDLDSEGHGQSHAQLQQDPKPKEGGLFKSLWWKRYDTSPSSIIETVQFWDCAQKPGITNDWSVCATWAKTAAGFFLLDIWREKVEEPELEVAAVSQADLWRPDAIVIEDKSAGSSVIQHLLRETTLPVLPYNPGKADKELRATAASPTVKAGKCHLPSKPIYGKDESGREINLIEAFIKEHERFNKAPHDDMVDTTSMMVAYFVKRGVAQPRIRSL